jgi:SNW domain-containing protein 1
MGTEAKMKMKARSAGERDISEKIALGLAAPTHSGETMYDQRLFNQSEGMSTGFADDEGIWVMD